MPSNQRHLYLIGYRGSGKTSVGRRLAQVLHRESVDTDDLIETQAGRTIREIFADEQEAGFRDRETQVIEDLEKANTPMVVSLGGGAILRETNQAVLKRSGYCVWLHASAASLAKRLEADQATAERRPALTKLTTLEEIEQVLTARTPIYRAVSDVVVDTENRDVESIAEEIEAWWKTIPSH